MVQLKTAQTVFEKRNWIPNNESTCHKTETRVFTYMIGRELGDPKHIRWMSCATKDRFYFFNIKHKKARMNIPKD